jgi:N-acetylmuramoyl-L-alanine amidase
VSFAALTVSIELEYKSFPMRALIFTLITVLIAFAGLPSRALALVEIGRPGQDPLVIEDVYQREGTAFIAIDDVLLALELEGDWNSVKHVYSILTPHGRAVISPGSQYLRLGDNFLPITHRPRFIDGKLRVSEAFVLKQLAPLLAEPIRYRNHNPPAAVAEEDPLDRLFAFLLRKKPTVGDARQWIVALDPGHGGQDPGVLAPDGRKEKAVTLAVSQRLEKLLKMHQDAPVVLTRDDDYALALEQRLVKVGESGADVLLSLHAQSFAVPEVAGVMLFVQPETERDAPGVLVGESASLELARNLSDSLTSAGFKVAAIQERPVMPLGRGDLPRVLVEMGYLSNPDDMSMLFDATRQQDVARALFNGLQSFFTKYEEHDYDLPPTDPQRREIGQPVTPGSF